MTSPSYVGNLSHYDVRNPRSYIVQTVSQSLAFVSQLDPLAFDELVGNKAKVFYILGHDPKEPILNDTEQSCVIKHVTVTHTFTLPPGAEMLFATVDKKTGKYPFVDEELIQDYVCTIEAKRVHHHTPSNYIPGTAQFPDSPIKYYVKSFDAKKIRHRNLTSRDITVHLIKEVKSTDFSPASQVANPDGI